MEMNNDIAREFLIESREAMDKYDSDLLALEKNPADPSYLSNIFRSLHTLKGSCGFLGFVKLEWLTHKGENLLSNIRDGKLTAGKEVVTCLFKLGDSIRDILKTIAENQTEGGKEYSGLLAEMDSFQSDWVGLKAPLPAAPAVENPSVPVSTPMAESAPAP